MSRFKKSFDEVRVGQEFTFRGTWYEKSSERKAIPALAKEHTIEFAPRVVVYTVTP